MNDIFQKYLPWFILKEVPGLGNILLKRLLDYFKTPENILNAAVDDFSCVDDINSKIIKGIQNSRQYETKAAHQLNGLLNAGISLTVLTDNTYPELLKQITDPPPVLTYFGTLSANAPCISIVGSRNATAYGMSSARQLAYDLALKGFTIVSGMARGIDTAAHQGALDANGKTIAVMGSGLNRIYPPENKSLFSHICQEGAVVSEFYLDAAPLPAHFPIRNRIIAGLSAGTVVVEAAKKSGSLITARLSSEYGRETFAVPGSIKSENSTGTHSILKQGAILVESHMDIIDELSHFFHPEPAPATTQTPVAHSGLTPPEMLSESNQYTKAILAILEPYPIHIDTIIQTSQLDAGGITAALLELELMGCISRSSGNFFNILEEKRE